MTNHLIEANEARIISESIWSAEYVENRDMVILMLDKEIRKECNIGKTTASIDMSMKKLKHLSIRFWMELRDDIKEYGYSYASVRYPNFIVYW